MIDYPIDIEEFEANEYDPFLHHIIRHKLRKKKNRRRLGKLLGKHPKARILRSIGIGRRRRSTRPVRTFDKRYRKTVSRRPSRNTIVSRPGIIKKPFRRPPVKLGNPMNRTFRGNKGISMMGVRKPPISVPNTRRKPKVSRDTVLPYRRRYGSGKARAIPKSVKARKRTKPQREEELPIIEESINASDLKAMKGSEKEKKPAGSGTTRKMQNILGIAALTIVVVGVVAYKIKSKIEINGRTR